MSPTGGGGNSDSQTKETKRTSRGCHLFISIRQRNAIVEIELAKWSCEVSVQNGQRLCIRTVDTEGGLPLHQLEGVASWFESVLGVVIVRHISTRG